VVQTLPLMAAQAPTFQRFHEAINQAKLSARQAELERAWDSLPREPSFQKAFSDLLSRCVKRPTALLQAERLGADFGGASVYRKYEDERGSGDVAAINALGQVLLASRMGKKRVVAGSVSGTHGVAVANAATQLGLDCTIYMMHGDQGKNPEAVRRMHELGATVITVHSSMAAPSDDVRIRALDDWMQDGESTLYINSVDAGPYPYPSIVLHFQSAVGREARAQMLEATGGLPDAVITSTGDGLSAIGLLQSFLSDSSVALYCVEAGAGDAKQSGHHFRREHSWLRASGRVSYISVDSAEAVQAVVDAARLQDWSLDAGGGEVLAQAHRVAGELGAGKKLLVMLPRPQSNQAGALPLRAAS
jgi:tryptophan synthase beta chain